MRILVGMEESGVIRDAFAALGHDAWSCDLRPTRSPGNHLQADVFTVLDDGWDLGIFHPECTYLCVSGLHWNKRRPGRAALTEKALDDVRRLLAAPIGKLCIENPVGCISTRIEKPAQVVQPYDFGDDASKGTCFWLRNLSPQRRDPARFVEPMFGCRCGHRFAFELGKYGCPNCGGSGGAARHVWSNQTAGGQNRLGPSPDRARLRAQTYPGIAAAMAEQWGGRP